MIYNLRKHSPKVGKLHLMDKPVIATRHSIKVEVTEGQIYSWCSCGLSQNQPFCDGSHRGTSFKPIKYTAERTGLIGFCGCKYSKKGAICDGAHRDLPEE